MSQRATLFIGVLGALASIVALLISSDLRALLLIELSVSIWQIGLTFLLGISIGVLFLRWASFKAATDEQEIVLLQRSRMIVHSDPDSVEQVGVRVLTGSVGTVALWVYVSRKGTGVRAIQNNRYLFSCATSFSGPYKNVFAIAYGPMTWSPPSDPAWILWVKSSKHQEKWTYPDSGEFRLGWHHILVRWDHSEPLLEMLIDGEIVASSSSYLSSWPERFPDRAFIGSWPNKRDFHFIDSYLARFRMSRQFANKIWIQEELAMMPEDPPN